MTDTNKLFHIKNQIWLAPLAGYTDAPFRFVAKKCGADVVVSEMVSADGVKKSFDRMVHYTKFTEFERPFGIQLFGDNPLVMARATKLLVSVKPDFFDINMGCPVKKVVKRYAGSALMTRPDLAEDIVREVSKVCQDHGLPLSVKIRAGWDAEHINAVEFAQMIENAGADTIIVHPRTRSQMFTGLSDWDIIRQVKQAVSVPVVGNGDIKTLDDAKRMYETTGCDSIMIGRGALGQPWIFNIIKGRDPSLYTGKFVYDIVCEHIDKVVEHNVNEHGLTQMRSHFAFYTKGYPEGAAARKVIFSTLDTNVIKETMRRLVLG
jgi:tRNA-dihydrouridine synthase B